MRLNAFRLKESWSDDIVSSDRYNEFLKGIFHSNVQPLYYSIKKCRQIATDDGPMLFMVLNTDIDNPGREIIAEAFINTTFLYCYQDRYWRIASGKERQLLYKPKMATRSNPTLALQMFHYTTKTMVIYAI